MPALLGLHHAKALAARPVEVVVGVAGAAQSDLHDARAVEQTFLHRAPERRAVRERLAEHVFVDVGVRVDVHEPERPVAGVHRAQHRQRERVVPAERDRRAAVREDRGDALLDQRDAALEAERVDRDVAEVGHLHVIEGRDARGHVVRSQHRRLRTDLARSEAGAAPMGGADVERHADEADVDLRRARGRRQAHHRHGTGEARHLVAAERLVERPAHDGFPEGVGPWHSRTNVAVIGA